ncbi:MAG: B12-binding domain-containing radical SAM protein [Proteobacteria bacterium]|nr:B12-binding domain-containing radical SAM protein [Pseudomonadota bacterium]
MSDMTLVNVVLPSAVKVPPHGCLYLISALEQAGYEVELRDYQQCSLDEPWLPDTLARFASGGARVLGMSCMSYALPLLIEAARRIKRAEPDRIIVAGGIGPSAVAGPLLDFCPDIDIVVVGEGERTVVELMDRLRQGLALDGIPGLVYRQGDTIRTNEARPRIDDLDQIAWPAYHHVDLTDYRIVDIQFGRGCPFDCSFCDIAPFWSRKHTRRPVERFVAEFETLVRDHGARDVFVIDDTFVLSRPTVLAICDEIMKRGLEFEWGCYARVDLMDDELMDRMYRAGCRKIFYGVESGSDRVLQVIDKAITTQRTADIIKRSVDRFPFVTTSFLWGIPDESLAELEETVCTLVYFAAQGACPQLNLALPYSYSALYKLHRDKIVFSPQHSSQLQLYEGDDKAWLIDMISRSSQLFSAFYRLPTGDFEEKWQFLDRVGLNPHAMQRSFFDHPVAA